MQIALQEHFTGSFKEIEKSRNYKFLSTFVPTHKEEAVRIIGSEDLTYATLPFFSRYYPFSIR